MSGRPDVHPPLIAIRAVVRAALEEDLLPLGDITAGLLDPATTVHGRLVARRPGVIAGTKSAAEVFFVVDPNLVCEFNLDDGDAVEAGGLVGQVSGNYASVLSAERSALNLLSHLSGVATLTRRFVDVVAEVNPAARLWDTRKTTPGLRSLEKAAVRAGGGINHRGNLSEGILVKDNHLGGLSITEAVARALARWPGRMVEVECETVEQVKEAASSGATVIMCDNMSPDNVEAAVELVRATIAGPRPLIEVSGGITLENIAHYARAGADLISVGAITHSAPVLDIGLDLE